MRSAVILFLIVFNISPALGFQNEPDGFRGIAWGTPIGQLGKEMKVVESHPDIVYYQRAGDSLKIGGAQLKEISYGFYKGKLSSVIIQATDLQKDPLYDAMEAQFGPTSKSDYEDFWIWEGTNTNISLDCNAVRCNAVFSSVASEAQKKADAAEAAKKAGKDF